MWPVRNYANYPQNFYNLWESAFSKNYKEEPRPGRYIIRLVDYENK
jgi:hypothetical protein